MIYETPEEVRDQYKGIVAFADRFTRQARVINNAGAIALTAGASLVTRGNILQGSALLATGTFITPRLARGTVDIARQHHDRASEYQSEMVANQYRTGVYGYSPL